MVVFRCWDFKCLLKEKKKQSTIETKIKSHMLNVDYNHFWQHRLGQRDVELIKNRAEWVFHFLFRGLRLVSTCLDIFPHGKGKYRISWCWITAGEEVHMWCFSFFFSPLPPPQLMPFPWFPLWCCVCPTLGHSAGRGDTPKYINSLTRSETHWFVPKYPVNCEKDRLHKSSPGS